MSEGITVRAELPSGMDHAAALSTRSTQTHTLLTVFMNYLEEYVRLDAIYRPYCMPI